MRGRAAVIVLLGLLMTGCSVAATPDEIPHHDDVAIIDETGWLLQSDDHWAGTSPPDIGTDTAVFNPDGQPRTLVVTWLSGVCQHDRRITLTQGDGVLDIALDMGVPDELPEGAGCPAMGRLYAVALDFDRPVGRGDVSLHVSTHL